MKIAMVTTPRSSRSGIADYTRHLLPYLREGAQVDLFVEIGREGEGGDSEELRSVVDLQPREYDQILYQLGNEAQHAFMVPLIRALGGTVMLHDWVLFDLSMAAHPSLQRGGLRGLQRAFTEGGAAEARMYLRNRRQSSMAMRGERFRSGWFQAEERGRWSSARAELDLPGSTGVRLAFLVPAGRTVTLHHAGQCLGTWKQEGEQSIEVELDPSGGGTLVFAVRGTGPLREAGSSPDERGLGVFLRSCEFRRGQEWCALNLDEPCSRHSQGLSADRFELTFNRSVVRHADAFLVHSDWVGEQILASRNAPTPIARVHHGVERRWNDEESASARAKLGLPSGWKDGLLIATFGALQTHKRPEVLLGALQRLGELGVDARLLCVGEERPEEFDLAHHITRCGLGGRVHVTGWMPEEEAWRALRAADLCVNLRGPSTGGTSGGASQALSLGKPVIVSDLPEFAHLPTDCVLRLVHGPGEVDQLARLIRDLARNPDQISAMERGARRAVEEELHWSHVAQRYRDILEGFPHARAARRSLLVRFLHATAKERHVKEPSRADGV